MYTNNVKRDNSNYINYLITIHKIYTKTAIMVLVSHINN